MVISQPFHIILSKNTPSAFFITVTFYNYHISVTSVGPNFLKFQISKTLFSAAGIKSLNLNVGWEFQRGVSSTVCLYTMHILANKQAARPKEENMHTSAPAAFTVTFCNSSNVDFT